MALPRPLDSAQTGTPDAATGIQLATVVLASSTTIEIPTGVMLSDQIPTVLTMSPHRACMTTTDTNLDMVGFGSSNLGGSTAEAIYNRGALRVWCEFASSCGRASVRPIWFDAQSTPQPVGHGSALTFAALELFTGTGLSSCGDKLSQPVLVDTVGSAVFKLRLESLTNSSDGVDVYGVPI